MTVPVCEDAGDGDVCVDSYWFLLGFGLAFAVVLLLVVEQQLPALLLPPLFFLGDSWDCFWDTNDDGVQKQTERTA